MITTEQYFGKKSAPPEHRANAEDLLRTVNALLAMATFAGIYGEMIDADTGTQISGSKGGSGDGGYRLPDAATGRARSSHKEAKGVDVFDPYEALDGWLTDEILTEFGLYREHPSATRGWCHLSTRAPRFGRRTFYP